MLKSFQNIDNNICEDVTHCRYVINLDGQQFPLQIIPTQVRWQGEVWAGRAVQGGGAHALGPGVVQVSLHILVSGLRHSLDTGLRLFAPASLTGSDIGIVTVTRVATVETVGQWVPL